jgi:hypothetical protein
LCRDGRLGPGRDILARVGKVAAGSRDVPEGGADWSSTSPYRSSAVM